MTDNLEWIIEVKEIMEFQIVCSTWIKKDDEAVLTALKNADRWLTAEELSEMTGLPLPKVQRTFRNLEQQMRLAKNRKTLSE